MNEPQYHPAVAEDQELELFVEGLRTHGRFFPIWLAFASLVGLLAASALVLDKISYWTQKAEGRLPVLGCDRSPLIGCGPVINTPPASIFWSLPNPVIGVVAFSALLTVAVLLISKVQLPAWFWAGLQVGVVFGLGVVSYLQYESIYSINALCPYCMVIWSVMIPTFWAVTSRNMSAWTPLNPISSFLRSFLPFIIVLHFVALCSLIWLQFGSALFA